MRLVRVKVILVILLIQGVLLAQPAEKRASFDYGKTELQSALFKLKEIYGVDFSYGNNAIPLRKTVVLKAENKTLREVLDEILPKVGVTYKIIGATISLRAIQFKQVIRGKVVDKSTSQELPGANVVVLGLDSLNGASADANGNFSLGLVNVGRYALKISLVGYEEVMLSDVIVEVGHETIINVGLKEAVVRLQEIVVRPTQLNGQALNSFSLSGGRSFSAEETKRFASNFNDPARMMTAYPGIAANNDATNSLAIRGNSPNGMQWRLEGTEIPSPSHFSSFGGSGGGVSMLSLNMIDKSDFFPGALAAEYGNALSGVMDIKLRKGNNLKHERSFQAGAIGLDLAAEGPFSKKNRSSYLVNYRYSTLGLLQGLGFFEEGAVPQYQDMSFNLSFPTENSSTNVWGILGDGIINENVSGDGKNRLQTRNAFGGITHRRNFENNSSFILAASATAGTDDLTRVQSVNSIQMQTRGQQNTSYSFRVSPQFNKRFSSSSAIRTGLVFSYQKFQLNHFYVDQTTGEKVQYVDGNGNTGYLQGYGQWKKQFGDKLVVNAGVHGILFLLNSHYSVEPRLGLNYEISPNQNLSAAAGVHSRLQPLTMYYGSLQQPDGTINYPNKNLDFSKAIHYVAGYDRMLGEHIHTRLEAYYQSLYSIPVYYDSNGPAQFTTYSAINQLNEYLNSKTVEAPPIQLSNTGTGTNYGVELTLERFFTKNSYFLLTGSLYQSTYKGSDNISRNTAFNGQYIFTALAGKEYQTGIGKNNTIELNARITWMGNNRQTPYNVVDSWLTSSEVYYYDRSYELRLPDYFRIDLHFGFRKNRARASHTWSFDLRNATNRNNVHYQWLNFNAGKIDYTTQLGVIPVLNYRIEF
ncbi:prevent-host-death protein [Cytophagales bacterium WSM2-2]|nr:prevent-host-death protein [Cytophagales bacterium WSM2-2]